MSGKTISSGTINEPKRKKLHFRAWHRGMREMDLILGPFADDNIGKLDAASLDEFEELMDVNDQELYRWIIGENAVPDRWQGELFDAIVEHRRNHIG